MTPTAITPAGRRATTSGRTAEPAAPGHRRKLPKKAAPKAPRRVSGPLPTRNRGSVVGRSRRSAGSVSAPARRGAAARPGLATPIPARALAFVRALPDHSLLDRVVRGRAWIPLLGVMLAGIVAMQVEVLKLGASIGRSMQRSTALESRNGLLRASVARLGDDQRIEQLAAGMGMLMPAPNAVGFLSPQPANAGQAVANIHAPSPAAFASLVSSNGAVVTPASTATSSTAGAGGPSSLTAPPVAPAQGTASSQTAVVAQAPALSAAAATPQSSTPTGG